MGYYTYYTLDYTDKGNPAVDEKVARALAKHEVLGTSEQDLETYLSYHKQYGGSVCERFIHELISSDDYKWYNHEEDMRRVSREVPDVLFTLWGKGEDWEDRWVLYFKHGAMGGGPAQITIEYPECNPYWRGSK